MSLNPYAVPNFLCFLGLLGLATFVYTRRRRSPVGLAYLLLCLSASAWQIGTFFVLSSTVPELALRFCRLTYIGSLFIPATTLHFVTAALGEKPAESRVLRFVYGIWLLVFLPLSQTPWFISGVYSYDWGYWWQSGPLHPVFLSALSIVLGIAFFKIVLAVKTAPSLVARKRRQILFTGLLVAYIGAVDYVPNYGLEVYPFGYIPIFLHLAIYAYAIVRYRFLDIEVIIKKTLVFTGLFAMVMGVVGAVTTVSQELLSRYWVVPTALSMGLSVFAAILLYEPTKNTLVHLTDRFLFQKKQSIKEVLRRLSGRIITILNLGEVAKTILETFEESLRAETGALLLKTPEGYVTLKTYGIQTALLEKVYSPQDPLIQFLAQHKKLIRIEEEETRKKLPVLFLARMEDLKAVMAVPLFLHDALIGVLTLGKKKSDQEYTAEEIDYFPTVAGQVAIALSNARLYGESIEARKKIEEMQIELIHREKMAFVADLVKGIAHEVFNPLLPIFHAVENLEQETFVGMFEVFKKEESRLDPASRREYLNHLKGLRDYTHTLKRNSRHIHLVIDTLNKMQKGDRETVGPMDFKIFLQDSRALIGMELHSDNREIPCEEDVPPRLPPLNANPTLLTQVFVNLFKNAIQAMEGRPEKKIWIKAEVDPENQKFLKIGFSDSGAGIPAEILPKIFDYRFTTKGAGGQGIGLNQCRLIIEKFGGSITCRSEAGRGTTFTLKLPIWEESKK